MKLYPLIYTNEAARTASESLEKGIVAVKSSGNIVLLSKRRVLEAIKSMNLSPGIEPTTQEIVTLSQKLSNRAVVGAITYEKVKNDLYKIFTSAGVSKFGPLAYQIAMYRLGDSWIRSDYSLRVASLAIWQNMYELSDKGVYERKWLGDWDWRNIAKAVDTWSEATEDTKTQGYLENYLQEVEAGDVEEDAAGFTEYLQENPMKGGVGAFQYDMQTSPYKFGNFWAYRKVSHDPLIEDMFNDGEHMFEEVKTEYGVSPGTLNNIIEAAAERFFRRRYDTT